MNKYQNGKIYIITGSETDKVYLGSTIMPLKRRLSCHKSSNSCSSREIFIDKEYNICLLETYPCNSRKELLWRERYWFDELKSILVNNDRPIITEEEKRLKDRDHKRYLRETDKEKVEEYYKEWRKNNKEKIGEKKKKTWKI